MDKKELPENIRQAIDLIFAVLRRIKAKQLDKSQTSCLLYTRNMEGALT